MVDQVELVERVARIRETIRKYGPDDWFQGCLHGGGIYMRDLRPVLDTASHHAELAEALEDAAAALDSVMHDDYDAFYAITRAAFEKARDLLAKLPHPNNTGEV